MAIAKRVLSVKKDFDMNSTSYCKFHHSQWEPCLVDTEHASVAYLVYRLSYMVILVSSMTFSTLCQSYLFEIFLTNWSFTLQTLYAVLFSFTICWRMRRYLMESLCMKVSRNQVYPEPNAKNFEMNEANKASWENVDTTTSEAEDRNAMIDNQEKNESIVKIGNGNEQQAHTSCSGEVATTDSCCARKADTSVVIISNNNNDKGQIISIDNPPNILEKIIWVLMNVSHVLPHVVSFGYWIFVYKYDPDQKACERFRSHFIVHGATSLLAFIDSLVVAVPVRKSHFIFPSFVLVTYAVFSFIYEAAGGPYREGKEFIYSILNWRHKPGRTLIICFVGMILSPLMHLITCWGIHHVKLWLAAWHMRRRALSKK